MTRLFAATSRMTQIERLYFERQTQKVAQKRARRRRRRPAAAQPRRHAASRQTLQGDFISRTLDEPARSGLLELLGRRSRSVTLTTATPNSPLSAVLCALASPCRQWRLPLRRHPRGRSAGRRLVGRCRARSCPAAPYGPVDLLIASCPDRARRNAAQGRRPMRCARSLRAAARVAPVPVRELRTLLAEDVLLLFIGHADAHRRVHTWLHRRGGRLQKLDAATIAEVLSNAPGLDLVVLNGCRARPSVRRCAARPPRRLLGAVDDEAAALFSPALFAQLLLPSSRPDSPRLSDGVRAAPAAPCSSKRSSRSRSAAASAPPKSAAACDR